MKKANVSIDTRSEATDLTRAIGARIRSARVALGMTQVQLAEAAWYQNSTSITYIEQGRNTIKPDSLLFICKALKMSPNELFGWNEEG